MTKTATLSTWCLWLVLIIVKSVESFSSGAPYYACRKMKPAHSGDPLPYSPDTFPYLITLNPDRAMPGEIVTVTVSAKSSDDLIMGLLATVRDSDNNLMTGLISPDNLRLLNCTWSMGTMISDSGVTHKQRLNTVSQTFSWTVPSQAVQGSQYTVRITVVKDLYTHWVGTNTTLTIDTNTRKRSPDIIRAPPAEISSTTTNRVDKVVSEPNQINASGMNSSTDDRGQGEKAESGQATSGAKITVR